MTKKSTEQSFWNKANKNGLIQPHMTTPCWEWTKAKNKGGYGIVRFHGKFWLAHRLSYFLYYDDISNDLDICHHCDNCLCINPTHLFSGTAKDNIQDMKIKGRSNYLSGSKNGNSKLTNEQVLKILLFRKNGLTYEEIAKLFNVGKTTIAHIIKRDNWTHITIP